MKPPKYAALTMQNQIDVGINAFAVTLLAESFAKLSDQVGDESLCLVGYTKDSRPVYIIVSFSPPIMAETAGG